MKTNHLIMLSRPRWGQALLRNAARLLAVGAVTIATPIQAYSACSSPTGADGQMRWDTTLQNMTYCNGTGWKDFFKIKVSSSACINAGEITFVDTAKDIRMCDGKTWFSVKGLTLSACTSADTGTFKYDSTTHKVGFCDGTSWKDLTAPTTYPVASVAVAPIQTAIVGSVTQLSTRVARLNDQEVTGATITYTSSDPAVATVSSSGQMTAIRAGYTFIQASVQTTKLDGTPMTVSSKPIGVAVYYVGNLPVYRPDGHTPYLILDYNKSPTALQSAELITITPRVYDASGQPATISSLSVASGISGCYLAVNSNGVTASASLAANRGACSLLITVNSSALPDDGSGAGHSLGIYTYLVNISSPNTLPSAPTSTPTPPTGYLGYRYVTPGAACTSISSSISTTSPIYTNMRMMCQTTTGVDSTPTLSSVSVLGCTNTAAGADATFGFKCTPALTSTVPAGSGPSVSPTPTTPTLPSGYLAYHTQYAEHSCGGLGTFKHAGDIVFSGDGMYDVAVAQCKSKYGQNSVLDPTSPYVVSCTNLSSGADTWIAYACKDGTAPTFTKPTYSNITGTCPGEAAILAGTAYPNPYDLEPVVTKCKAEGPATGNPGENPTHMPPYIPPSPPPATGGTGTVDSGDYLPPPGTPITYAQAVKFLEKHPEIQAKIIEMLEELFGEVVWDFLDLPPSTLTAAAAGLVVAAVSAFGEFQIHVDHDALTGITRRGGADIRDADGTLLAFHVGLWNMNWDAAVRLVVETDSLGMHVTHGELQVALSWDGLYMPTTFQGGINITYLIQQLWNFQMGGHGGFTGGDI